MSEIPGVETTNPAANLSQCTSSLFPTKMAVLPGITLAIDRNSMSKCQHWKVGEKSVKCPANDATALNSPGMAGSRRKSQSSRAPKSCCCRAQAARIRRCYKFFALHFSIEWGKALLWHWSEDAQDAQAPLKWVSTSKFLGTCCTRWDDATFSPLCGQSHGFSVRSGCGSSTQVDFLPNITSFACRHCAAVPIRLKFWNLSSPQQINMNIWMIVNHQTRPPKQPPLGILTYPSNVSCSHPLRGEVRKLSLVDFWGDVGWTALVGVVGNQQPADTLSTVALHSVVL